jgi:hypothetical protein
VNGHENSSGSIAPGRRGGVERRLTT